MINLSMKPKISFISLLFGLIIYFLMITRIAMRQQGDFIRSVYPKLILEGGTSTNSDGAGVGGTMPLSTASLKKPPLAR